MQRNQLLSQSHLSTTGHGGGGTNHCKNNKSVVFPINELERPTIDAVLNSVPLFYDPITKQLVLQRDFDCRSSPAISHSNDNRSSPTIELIETRSSPKFDRTLDLKPDCKNLTVQAKSSSTISTSDSLLIKSSAGRKLLETRLDDFTTQSKSPPKPTFDDLGKVLLLSSAHHTLNGRMNTFGNLSGDCYRPSSVNECKQALLQDLYDDEIADIKKSLKQQQQQKLNPAESLKTSVASATGTNSQTTKEGFKRHRRTPSYIHDFHNLIKNTAICSKVNTTTASSAAAATAKLTSCSLADATNSLSNQTENISNLTKSSASNGKQLTINESRNQLNIFEDHDQPITSSRSTRTEPQESDIEREVEPLQLPSPFPEKTKRFSSIGHSLHQMLGKLRFKTTKTGNSAPGSFANSPASVHRPISAMACCSHSGSTSSITTSGGNSNVSNAGTSENESSTPSAVAVRPANCSERSTSGLILEQRPAHLPDKPLDEQLKHRALYEAMLREAKRKEQKDARLAKKQAARKQKEDEKMAEVIRCWQEILPNFDAVRNTRKVRDMWFQGIPPNLRGKVWQLAIGNELNISEELYHICLNRWTDLNQRLEAAERLASKRADDPLMNKLSVLQMKDDDDDNCKDSQQTEVGQTRLNGRDSESKSNDDSESDDNESSILNRGGGPLHLCYELQESEESIREQMRLDVSRTLPSVGLFQKRAPLHQVLLKVLGAYVFSYRPDVGYIQGMSFLAGHLLLHMDAPAAFTCFANLLNRNHVLLAFVRLDQLRMRAYYAAFDVYLALNAPVLHAHLQQQGLNCDLYLLDWILTLFTKALPLDLCARLWDLLFRDGEELIFRAALALLQTLQPQLLAADLSSGAQLLSRLQQQHAKYLDQTRFFQQLTTIKMGQVMVGSQPMTVKCKDFQAVFQYFWQREITKH